MLVADPSGPGLATILWTVLGGYLAAGGAGAINHYLERDRDARMDRTCGRPLVSGRIDPRNGLWFGVCLVVAATIELGLTVNDSPRPSRSPASWATWSSTRCGSSRGRRRTSSSAEPPEPCRRSSAGPPPPAG